MCHPESYNIVIIIFIIIHLSNERIIFCSLICMLLCYKGSKYRHEKWRVLCDVSMRWPMRWPMNLSQSDGWNEPNVWEKRMWLWSKASYSTCGSTVLRVELAHLPFTGLTADTSSWKKSKASKNLSSYRMTYKPQERRRKMVHWFTC